MMRDDSNRSDPLLDRRLADLLDDARTPSAPDSLRAWLDDLPDERPRVSRLRRLAIGSLRQIAAALAVVAVVAGAFLVGTTLPRTAPAAAYPTPREGGNIPSTPPVPPGWHFVLAFGQDGGDGLSASTTLPEAEHRVAVHVACAGPSDLLVLLTHEDMRATEPIGYDAAAEFVCGPGTRDRIEFTAPGGDFRSVKAVVIRSPAAIRETSFRVSIEAPGDAPK